SVTMPTSPKKDDWAFIKIPSFLGAARIYLIYGQDRTSWATTNVYTNAHAVWYLCDVDVPRFTTPQQIWLEISGLRGHAVRLYWNGQAVGTITNQQGGRVNLSNVAHPGEHGQLAIYALAAKPETKYAFLMEAGMVTLAAG
ncbi:MAG TPA: hypothetical protein VHV83_07600, partial [Armatimonadota bacterium]|nr:hypothetical protein [Armatimonadota bacterium]